MNNKGMTLVELLVTFSLLMIIIVGMFNLILDVKTDLDNKRMGREITEYSNFLNGDIHYDLITRKPIAIAIKITSAGNWTIKYNTNYNNDDDCGNENSCGITDTFFRVNSTIKEKNVTVKGEQNIANICRNYYPCAVYAYYNPQATANDNGEVDALFKSIAVNTVVNADNKYGVYYDNVFEELPYYTYLDLSRTKISMKFDNEYFVIDYPIYMADDDINYGFKIAYPISNIATAESTTNETDDTTE